MKLRIVSLTLAVALLIGVLGGKAVAQFGWLFPGFNPQQYPQQQYFPRAPGYAPRGSDEFFGDRLADLVGEGLEEAYDEADDILVVRETHLDSGLADAAAQVWPKIRGATLPWLNRTRVGR